MALDLNFANKTLTKNQDKVLRILSANENQAVRDVAKEYRALFQKIDTDLRKLYTKIGKGKITFEEAMKFNRLENLLKRSQKTLDEFYRDFNSGLNKYMVNAAKNSLFGYSWSLESAVNTDLAFDLSNKIAIDIAKDSPFTNVAKSRLYTDGVSSVRNTINQGLKQGKSYIKISKDLKDKLAINYRQAERIVRTESHRIYELAHNEEFLQSKAMGIDTYMILRIVITETTRKQSYQVDGERSNDEGKFKYPNGNYYIPGSTGNSNWDVNDRERAVQQLEGFEPKTRYVKGKGVLPEEAVRDIIKERLG